MTVAACTRCLRPLNNLFSSRRPPPSLPFLRSTSSSSSSPSAPPAASTPPGPSRAPQKRLRPSPAPSATRPEYRQLPYTPLQIRDRLVDLLATGQPREALRLFLHSLDTPHEKTTESTAEGHAWLFLEYRQRAVAFEAIEALQRKGYDVPLRLAVKLLEGPENELDTNTDALVTVLGWLSGAVVKERAVGEVDAKLLKVAFDALYRIGRGDWLAELFRVYRTTLKPGEVGESRLWAIAIKSKTQDGDISGAKALFSTWRTIWRASHPPPSASDPFSSSPALATPPPPGPYIALLSHYIDHAPSLPASRDPAYLFLSSIKHDGLVPSTILQNALLRLELSRSRLSSFWGLWAAFDSPSPSPTPLPSPSVGIARSPLSWSLAIAAKLKGDTLRRSKARSFKRHSPLLTSSAPYAALSYSELHTPPSRALFRTLLTDRQNLTSHRPSRRLPASTQTSDCLIPSLLNSFLDLFVARRDWKAAAVVLETFSVHRLEPDARTHGSVVLGVVKQWEKGKLSGARLVDEYDELGGGGEGRDRRRRVDEFGESEESRASVRKGTAGRRAQILGGPDSLALIRRILEGRRARVGLWTASSMSPEAARVEYANAATAEDEPLFASAPSVPVEGLSEMRDLRYLVALLQRCEDLSDEQWRIAMVETRREMLPLKKGRKDGEEEAEEDAGNWEERGRIDDIARWKHYAFGLPLRRQ